MKQNLPKKTASRPDKPKKPPVEKSSAASQHLGGQPENDEDARAAGFDSATAAIGAGKQRKSRAP